MTSFVHCLQHRPPSLPGEEFAKPGTTHTYYYTQILQHTIICYFLGPSYNACPEVVMGIWDKDSVIVKVLQSIWMMQGATNQQHLTLVTASWLYKTIVAH